MIRAFWAIPLPDRIKKELKRVQDKLKESGVQLKRVRPESAHLTLKFLGPVEESIVGLMEAAVSGIFLKIRPFELTLSKPGVFPDRENPRVVWLGLKGDLESLSLLEVELESAMEGLGLPRRKRPIHPHLTLGRIRSRKENKRFLAALDQLQVVFRSFGVKEAILYKSDLKPAGAVHTALLRFPFSGS